MRARELLLVAGALLLLAALPAAAQASQTLRAPSALSVAGRVSDPPAGAARAGARLAGVHAPEARIAGVVDILGGDLSEACSVICLGVHLVHSVRTALRHVAAGVLDQLAGGVASGGAWMMRKTAQLIQRTTTPALSARWFQQRYGQMRHVAVFFALLAFLAAIIAATAARNGSAMLATVGVRLPLAFALAGALAAITQLAVAVADNLAADFAHSFQTDTAVILGRGAKGLLSLAAVNVATGQAPVIPAIITIVVALFAIATSFTLWLELLVRDAGIYVVVFLAPLACAAMIWERCSALLTRTLWVLFGLVMCKPLMVALMSLAATGGAHGVSESLSNVLVVLVLLLLTCLTPWALLGIVPLLEGAEAHHAARRALTSRPGAVAGMAGRSAMQALMYEHFGGRGSSAVGATGSAGGSASASAGAAGGSGSFAATSGAAAGAGVGPAAVAAAAQAGGALRDVPREASERQSAAVGPSPSGTGASAEETPAELQPHRDPMPASAETTARGQDLPPARGSVDGGPQPAQASAAPQPGTAAAMAPGEAGSAREPAAGPSGLGAAGGAETNLATGRPPVAAASTGPAAVGASGPSDSRRDAPIEAAKEGSDEQ